MGTWGTDIFSDDLAADIRLEWRALVGDGMSGPDATRYVLTNYEEILSDPDVESVFWIALALTQHRAGRTEPSVRAAALQHIDDPRGQERWKHDEKLLKRRLAALEKARIELLSLPPAPKRIAKIFRDSCEWVAGEVIAYELRSGHWSLFRVVALHTDLGGTSPIVEVLNWSSPSRPQRAPTNLLVKVDIHETWPPESRVNRIMIGATSARQRPGHRVCRIEQDVPSSYSPEFAPFLVSAWPTLDDVLERHFGLK
jgi:hypothetical protein